MGKIGDDVVGLKSFSEFWADTVYPKIKVEFEELQTKAILVNENVGQTYAESRLLNRLKVGTEFRGVVCNLAYTHPVTDRIDDCTAEEVISYAKLKYEKVDPQDQTTRTWHALAIWEKGHNIAIALGAQN